MALATVNMVSDYQERPRQVKDIGSAVIAAALEDLRTLPQHHHDYLSALEFIYRTDALGKQHREQMCDLSNAYRVDAGLEPRNYELRFANLPETISRTTVKRGQRRRVIA